ncbi:GAF domain-containing protein [Dactylosporangium darangshiense]|uniref:GAF domain-containing protein n=1 Tax=Dactylosporangium darangshiense TaxID=579108 RepID=A0ABP8CYV5_9ACTN
MRSRFGVVVSGTDDGRAAEPGHDFARPVSPPAPDGLAGLLHQVCADTAQALSACGVGMSVMTADGVHGFAAASDPATARIEELQFTFGEGPCVDAFAYSRPVLMPNLDAAAANRWPVYTPAVTDAGVRAVFAFPLQVGAARLGVLDVFRDRPGSLSRAELGQALASAERAVTALLDGQERTIDGTDGLDGAFDRSAALFQAQGMVMVQLGVSLAEALVRIRAHAYATGRPLHNVTADIVSRRLRLDQHSAEGSS